MADPTPIAPNHLQPVPLAPRPDQGRTGARLPVPLTSFVGREREVETIADLLRREGVRLVTLTGPGGVGKTRLAVRVAGNLTPDFPGEVVFVPLAPVRDPELVVPAIAHVLGVREMGDQPLAERLAGALHERLLLLVLDNFEQVVESGPRIADLLAACPRLTALVTSRVPLRLSGEHAVAVRPLPLPDPDPAPGTDEADAVRLFVARAGAVRAGFAPTDAETVAVADICRRLDGLPLAIELAAARIAHLPPAALLARLEHRLPLLTGGPRDAPRRQQTMRDAIAWSYDLLPSGERTLVRRLAVFAGGFTLGAAEAVAGDADPSVFDGLCALVDASLLQRDDGNPDEPRYLFLETVREYGLDQLAASGEADAVRAHHAAYFVALVERDRPRFGGIALPGPPARTATLQREDANLRAALEWAIERGDAETGLRLVTSLPGVWDTLGPLREARPWIERVVALGGDAAPELRVLAVFGLGFAAFWDNDLAKAADLGDQALTVARAHGDATGASHALNLLGMVATTRGDHARAEALFAEAVALGRQTGDPATLAWILDDAGVDAGNRGDHDRAIAICEESLGLWRGLGHDRQIGHVLTTLAYSVRERGDDRRSAELNREALATSWDAQNEELLTFLFYESAVVALAAGRATEAARLQGAAAHSRQRLQIPIFAKDEAELGRELATLRSALGETAFATAWAAGEALPVAEAVAEADAVLAAIAAERPVAVTPAFGLTPRELDVVRLLAEGHSNQQIADALFIGHRTATTHVRNILAKLDLDSRTAVAAWAIRHGLA